jgi:hypothetical protein
MNKDELEQLLGSDDKKFRVKLADLKNPFEINCSFGHFLFKDPSKVRAQKGLSKLLQLQLVLMPRDPASLYLMTWDISICLILKFVRVVLDSLDFFVSG